MEIEIIRNNDNGIEILGTLTVINDQGANVFQCKTLEKPYKNNEHGISSIPPGIYTVEKVGASHIPYPHFAIQNVPNRDGICIHKANFVSQLEGCIAVGTAYAAVNGNGETDLLNSGVAFDELYKLMPDEFKITIK